MLTGTELPSARWQCPALPSEEQLQLASQKMAGAPKVYTGDMATAGSTPRRRYISISSVARLPPSECPCELYT